MSSNKPQGLRAASIALRSVHIVAMALVVGGLARGGTHETLQVGIILTVLSGFLLFAVELGNRCLGLFEGSGLAFFVKLGLLGLGNLFAGARLEWYIAATVVASIGSHMPGSWRHASLARRPADVDSDSD